MSHLTHPKGWGLYFTRHIYGLSASEVAGRAQKARKARVRNIVLLCEGEDGYVADTRKIRDVAIAYQELAGVDVRLYSLIGEDSVAHPAKAGERLAAAVEAVRARGPVADIERAFRKLPDAVVAFLAPLLQLDPRTHDVGVSSYPIMSWHPDIPWGQMRWGWGNPQIYKTAANRAIARQALGSWREAHGVAIPAIAGFDTASPGDGREQLQGDANRVLLDDKGQCDVPGALVWADSALDSSERAFMAEWAERWGW